VLVWCIAIVILTAGILGIDLWYRRTAAQAKLAVQQAERAKEPQQKPEQARPQPANVPLPEARAVQTVQPPAELNKPTASEPPMGTLARLDWENGIAGLKFGQPLTAPSDWKEERRSVELIDYYYIGEQPLINVEGIERIVASTADGAVCMVDIMASSERPLREWIEACAGPAEKRFTAKGIEYAWQGKRVQASLTALVDTHTKAEVTAGGVQAREVTEQTWFLMVSRVLSPAAK
jgi:hypothetical protein